MMMMIEISIVIDDDYDDDDDRDERWLIDLPKSKQLHRHVRSILVNHHRDR